MYHFGGYAKTPYMPFYGALDVLAGMGTGLVLERATTTNQPELVSVNSWLFAQGNQLAEVGVWAYLLACLLTSLLLLHRTGRRAAPGALLLVISALSFLRSHIYYPVGVATMLLMAAGFAWLQWVRLSRAASQGRA